MAGLRTYDPGVPSWVDVSCHDSAKAAAFYHGLFGWEAVSQGPAEQTGGYAIFQLGGRDVAGIGPGEQPSWTVYVAVADVDATAEQAAKIGATVLLEPLTVPSAIGGGDAGRMAVLADPEGATFAAWQSADHPGADVVGEPGTFAKAELAVREVDTAKEFYGTLFGWEGVTRPFAEGTSTFTDLSLPDGTAVGGIVQMNDQWPDDIPAHWMPYFAVADTDATAAKAAGLGGSVSVGPFDLDGVGRIAVLGDPEGAAFSVIAPI